MKSVVIALVISAFAAGSVSAAGKATDLDFLKANRCKGLATSINGVVDPAMIDSYIKAERDSRAPYVRERADEEFQRARREAKSEDRRERLTAELNSSCQAYLGRGADVSKQ